MARGVAIVAAEARTALGEDLDTTWKALLAGASAVKPVRGFDAGGFEDPQAAQIWSEPLASEDDPALRILGPHGRLLESVARRAHEMAGAASLPRDRVGLYVSMGMVDAMVEDLVPAIHASRDDDGAFDLERFFQGAYRQVHPLWPLASLGNVAVGQVSIDLDLRGDNVVIASEADGTVRTFIEAADALGTGRTDAALAGGVSERVSPAALARARLAGVLGTGPAVPGSADGTGCSLGEGAAALILARESPDALAVLCGGATVFGPTFDGRGPCRSAYGRAVRGALENAGRTASSIDAVFLHAFGCAYRDKEELLAVSDVFADVENPPRLVATKGALGHTGPAAPAIDLALAARAIQTGRLPPFVRTATPLEEAERLFRDDARPLRSVLIVAASSRGSVGALLVEAAR